MNRYHCIRIVDDRYQVGVTTDGRDFVPLPRAAFGNPRDAIRYADMRQADVSPLREADDEVGGAVRAVIPAPSSASPSGLTAAG
jgi:hypothetical protein